MAYVNKLYDNSEIVFLLSFLLINFRCICSLIYARTFWDTLYTQVLQLFMHKRAMLKLMKLTDFISM